MLNRFVSVCRDLCVTFGWYVVVAFAVIVAAGIYACAVHNVGLMVVTALAIVLLVHFGSREDDPSRAERETQAIEHARKVADQIKLQRARSLLAEPSLHQVMPNHGAEQEL